VSSSRVEVKSGLAGGESWAIGEVSALFGLNPSTLRYWEDEGLLVPAGRRSGRRVYVRENLRRIALIVRARDTGLMGLREIQAILDGDTDQGDWHDAVQSRLDAIDRQRARLETARGYLTHIISCPSDHPADNCPYLASELDRALSTLGVPDPVPAPTAPGPA
jgi:DNA-binding transcriptional MerR regulator